MVDNYLAVWLRTVNRYRAEIDAVALAGRSREAVLAGEAQWARCVSRPRLLRDPERKAQLLPRRRSDLMFALSARVEVRLQEQPGVHESCQLHSSCRTAVSQGS